MQELLRAAEKLGWKTALESYAKLKNQSVLDLVFDPRRSSFLKLLQLSPKGVAVDIGCGYGGISLQLAHHCQEVIALDSGLERLQFLNVVRKQEHISNIRPIHHENITSLPFADNSVDVIVFVGVFEYLPLAYPLHSIKDVQQCVLREVHRVLKAGGYLYIGTKNRFGWQYWKGAADHNGLKFGPILPRSVANGLSQWFYKKPYRIVVDSLPAYRKMLEIGGFGEVQFYWPIPGYQFASAFEPLGADGEQTARAIDRLIFRGWKRQGIATLRASGLLKYVVPHFSLVAQKG